MEIVISSAYLSVVGGAETYVLTVAEQLQWLGHGVTLFTREAGHCAALALERGLEVRVDEDELPERCDIVLANDAITAYELADRYPRSPLIFTTHADEYDLATPPQLPNVAQAVVTLSDRAERRVRALAHIPEMVRLRQPIDTKRFYPRGRLNNPPKRVLMLGNWLEGDRRDMIIDVCKQLGLECTHLGFRAESSTVEPELELCRADIVIGKGRVILEAMASGRAAYVYDHKGGDGWVTPERYELLEADAFGSQAQATEIGAERLRQDLLEYDPEMGIANRDLVLAHHSAKKHVQALVALCERLTPRERHIDAPLREFARLVRTSWAREWAALHWAREAQRLRAELDRAEAELAELRAEAPQDTAPPA